MAQPLKIGIIAHMHYPIAQPFAGGLEVHTHVLASKLIERGHQVTLFATPQSDSALQIEPIHHELLKVDYTILPQTVYEDDHIRFHQEHHAYQALMLRLRESDYDVIHNNSVHYLPVSMAPLLPMPVISSLHTPPFPWLHSAVKLEQPHHKVQYACVSEALAKEWKDVLQDYSVVHNGIDTHFWKPVSEIEDYAVWTGRIVPEKGLHYALDAAEIAGVPLKIAGLMQDEGYFAREIAPRLVGKAGKVEYLGHLGHEQTRDLIAKAKVFLATPCWEEPFGLTVAEAMCCGTPVVAFKRGAMAELVQKQSGRVVTANDAEEMAKAMQFCIANISRKAVRKRGEHFSIERMVDGYEKLYRQHAVKTMDASAFPLQMLYSASA